MMRRNLSLLGLASVFLLAFSLAVCAEDAAPKVHLERTLIDYGKVPTGKIVRPRFSFKNVGSAPLKITNRLFLGKFIQLKVLDGC